MDIAAGLFYNEDTKGGTPVTSVTVMLHSVFSLDYLFEKMVQCTVIGCAISYQLVKLSS